MTSQVLFTESTIFKVDDFYKCLFFFYRFKTIVAANLNAIAQVQFYCNFAYLFKGMSN